MTDIPDIGRAGPDRDPVVLNPDGQAPVLILCDHASNAVPARIGELGLDANDMRDHIAWDIGAKELALKFSERFDAPLICGLWSRLVVDLNRYPDDPSCLPPSSDGRNVPANQGLGEAERRSRIQRYFEPYHALVSRTLDAMTQQHDVPAVFMVHSFTPQMNGTARPWHLGLLFDTDDRLAEATISELGDDPGFVVGRNEPYTAVEPRGYSMFEHCVKRRLPYLCIEVRQDLLADAQGVEQWADQLSPAIGRALTNPDYHVLATAP